jgi:hypothetical protein
MVVKIAEAHIGVPLLDWAAAKPGGSNATTEIILYIN